MSIAVGVVLLVLRRAVKGVVILLVLRREVRGGEVRKTPACTEACDKVNYNPPCAEACGGEVRKIPACDGGSDRPTEEREGAGAMSTTRLPS